jgi:hypothetical protein
MKLKLGNKTQTTPNKELKKILGVKKSMIES